MQFYEFGNYVNIKTFMSYKKKILKKKKKKISYVILEYAYLLLLVSGLLFKCAA